MHFKAYIHTVIINLYNTIRNLNKWKSIPSDASGVRVFIECCIRTKLQDKPTSEAIVCVFKGNLVLNSFGPFFFKGKNQTRVYNLLVFCALVTFET